MTAAGVISGFKDGTFRPGETLTRGQATKVLVLWQGVKLVKPPTPSFPDLDDVYRDYVETAAAQGWITGFPDGRFRPYATLSRQQMAIIMVRAMGWDAEAKKLASSQIEQTLSAFSDSVDIATVARPYVALAVQRGLFGGTDGRFEPKDGITRAQFALVVFRAELSLRAVIQQVRFAADYPDKTRVVIDLSRAPGKVTAAISADGTLTIDYQGGAIAGTLSQAVESQEVKSVGARQYAYDPRTVRVTLTSPATRPSGSCLSLLRRTWATASSSTSTGAPTVPPAMGRRSSASTPGMEATPPAPSGSRARKRRSSIWPSPCRWRPTCARPGCR